MHGAVASDVQGYGATLRKLLSVPKEASSLWNSAGARAWLLAEATALCTELEAIVAARKRDEIGGASGGGAGGGEGGAGGGGDGGGGSQGDRVSDSGAQRPLERGPFGATQAVGKLVDDARARVWLGHPRLHT